MKRFDYSIDSERYWKRNKDFHLIDPVPSNEPCTPAGKNLEREEKEGLAFIKQLYRQFPKMWEYNVTVELVFCPHEFGEYSQVLIIFDKLDWQSVDYALKIVDNVPGNWDDISKEEIG